MVIRKDPILKNFIKNNISIPYPIIIALIPVFIFILAIGLNQLFGDTHPITQISFFILTLLTSLTTLFSMVTSIKNSLNSKKYSEKLTYIAYSAFWLILSLLIQAFFIIPVAKYSILIADILVIIYIIINIKQHFSKRKTK